MTAVSRMRRRLSDLDVASRAAALSFTTNALLMLAKLAVGLVFGSIAVLGDGVDSAEDVVASGIALFTVRLALHPADDEHPYGHGKAESLAAMSQAALIAGGGAFIAIAAVRRLITRDVNVEVGPSLTVMICAVVLNLGVFAYSTRAARISGSVAIAADARHLLTNVAQAGAVIVGLALVGATGVHAFDPLVALVLAAYLAWIAFGIFRAALRELIDTALPPETLARLDECLRHESHGMRGYHALRTRKSGREVHIDLHAIVDPTISVSEAHVLVDDLERDVAQIIPGAIVTVHVDPDEPNFAQADALHHAHSVRADR
jgi:ferrous-iron efflux pump FieF